MQAHNYRQILARDIVDRLYDIDYYTLTVLQFIMTQPVGKSLIKFVNYPAFTHPSSTLSQLDLLLKLGILGRIQIIITSTTCSQLHQCHKYFILQVGVPLKEEERGSIRVVVGCRSSAIKNVKPIYELSGPNTDSPAQTPYHTYMQVQYF